MCVEGIAVYYSEVVLIAETVIHTTKRIRMFTTAKENAERATEIECGSVALVRARKERPQP